MMDGENHGIFVFIRPYLKRLLLALFFMTMVAMFTAMFAFIIQPIMDELFVQSAGGKAAMSGKGVIVIFLMFL